MTDKNDFAALKELACALIRNRCVNDGNGNGGEERNAEVLTDFFAEAGLKAETVYGPGNRANLYLIGRERAGVPTYGLMGHTDGEARWSFPPFCGDIEDGYLRGRGAVDMLGQLAAMAAAVRTHMKSGGGKNVRFFAMADEEADGACGAAWFTQRFPDLIRCDAVFRIRWILSERRRRRRSGGCLRRKRSRPSAVDRLRKVRPRQSSVQKRQRRIKNCGFAGGCRTGVVVSGFKQRLRGLCRRTAAFR